MLLRLLFIVWAGRYKVHDSVGEHHAVAFPCTINEWLVLLGIVTNAFAFACTINVWRIAFDSAKQAYSKVLTSSNQWIMVDHFVFLPLCDFHPLLLYLVVWFVVVAVGCLTCLNSHTVIQSTVYSQTVVQTSTQNQHSVNTKSTDYYFHSCLLAMRSDTYSKLCGFVAL